ncbi:MAG: hypothetical protein PHT69_16880 [Bacteroidales bacterium]|nr:hypothetical protein [Bacteroidales bacterium]
MKNSSIIPNKIGSVGNETPKLKSKLSNSTDNGARKATNKSNLSNEKSIIRIINNTKGKKLKKYNSKAIISAFNSIKTALTV